MHLSSLEVEMPQRVWKVGELAARTGISVRTLHHYDAIGLLIPSGRSGSVHGSGHRLYTESDLSRLHQILCLKQLGFSLEQVRDFLNREDYDPQQVLRLHLEQVRQQIQELTELGTRLEGLALLLDRTDAVSPETLLESMEVMTMIDKYYTSEQLNQLKARKEQVGEDRIREVEAEWPGLIAEVQAAMAAGTDPTDQAVQQLARRWFALVREFTGGDPGITRSLNTMYQTEEKVMDHDQATWKGMMEYIQKAATAAGITLT